MPAEDKVLKLISELIRRTIDGSLKWRVADAPEKLIDGTDNRVPIYFAAEFRGQRIGIARLRYQTYDGELDRFLWNERVILIFLDSSHRVIWEHVEYSSALVNLFEVVRESAANIDRLIDGLLG